MKSFPFFVRAAACALALAWAVPHAAAQWSPSNPFAYSWAHRPGAATTYSFSAMVKEIAKWDGVVKTAGIKPE